MNDEKPTEELKTVPTLLPGDVPGKGWLSSRDSGVREAQLFNENLSPEQIAARAAHAEHARTENFRNHFEKVAIYGLWLVAGVVALIGATWFYHLITPESWHWLSPDGIAKIQNIVTGGVLAAVAGGHLKKRVG